MSAEASSTAAAQPAAGQPTISNAELKKLQKAEKAARRAAQKGGPPAAAPTPAPAASTPATPSITGPTPASPAPQTLQRHPSDSSRADKTKSPGPAGPATPGSNAAGSLSVPSAGRKLVARRQSVSGRNTPSGPGTTVTAAASEPAGSMPASKNVAFFGHLYDQSRRRSVKGAPKNIHPQVVSLGVQMSNYVVCGSSSRCLAMLQAFKEVIRAYTTPVGTSLPRHLVAHVLSPHIEYLKSCRPLSVSMGNAIRILKDHIVKIDPSMPEADAKDDLIATIDTLAQERIILADSVIRMAALPHIDAGDIIVVYAKSSIVLDTLLHAHKEKIAFSVIVVDSRPLFEGRHMLATLHEAGISATYALMNQASYVVDRATKLFLGAHAIMGNGNLFSRVGTAVVAMLAHRRNIPVVVCCEAIKFTDRVALDSIVMNEIAPADELFIEPLPDQTAAPPGTSPMSGSSSGNPSAGSAFDENRHWARSDRLVEQWTRTPGLHALNLMYDVTPAQFISMIVTEYGVLPPSAVLAVLRNMNGA